MISFLGGANMSFSLGLTEIIIIASIIFAVIIALYLLRSIGLYKLAKAQNFNCKFLAYVPFAWIYVAVKLIQEGKFFGVSIKKLTLLFTIIVSVMILINLAYQIIVYYPIVLNVLNGKEIYVDIGANIPEIAPHLKYYVSGIYVDPTTFDPPYFNITAINTTINVLSYAGLAFDLMSIFIKITIFMGIFKKYWPQKMLIATILSVFAETIAFPIFIFLIRNKKPVNYEEYMRRKYQYYRNPYGAYGQGPYGQRPYGQNPYGQNSYQSADQNRTENPFGEFADAKKADPFEEFSTKQEDPFKEFSKENKSEDKND